ncbi:DUF1232 domain-containing protein [Nocardioides euryhalodurans]|uniref:DUF1232 domain-containing protein n=1 Tax=Nocardioides euryhalodurans TaxID=2518370 RepID=A0A4P7GGD2_9ACTN|nr:YkvA family protein [Nocardioides euryhalodurans]QBR90908.1 DUF1232 domain-containing protein [Nocardioides euryhalodurans]
MGTWLDWLFGAVAGLIAAWLLLLAALWRARPDELTAAEALRLVPDVVRLLGRLARDPDLGWGLRLWLLGLLAYLAMPIDLVPDVIPVIGYADDAVVVVLALRAVARRAGPEALRRHWPGSADGLAAVGQLTGVRVG